MMLLALGLCATPGFALAHAFGQRYDLPLPLGFYLAGAGLAVALSFLGSFAFMRAGMRAGVRAGSGERFSILIPAPEAAGRVAASLARGVALAVLALVLATAVFGPASAAQNFSTVFVWVIWWVGFVLFSALVIDIWSVANPFATLVGAALRLVGAPPRRRQAPKWAEWLSVLGLIALSWTEIVSGWSEDPPAMAVLILLYTLGLLLGAAWLGRESWFGAADPISRLFGLLGRLAPVDLRSRGVTLRVPASGLVGCSTGSAGAVFVVTLVAIVLFDGLSETPFWASILQWITESQTLRPWLLALRSGGVDLMKLIRTLGLLSTISAAILCYGLLCLAVWRAGGRETSASEVFTGFAPSILPIAVGYHLAHYVFYLALAGQLIVPAAGDPFGLGWRLFGGAGGMIDAGVMTAEDVWWVAAAALVIGHALSVFVAHAQATRLFSTRRQVIRSQLPMMVFMVSLTSLSLWILAQPVVE